MLGSLLSHYSKPPQFPRKQSKEPARVELLVPLLEAENRTQETITGVSLRH